MTIARNLAAAITVIFAMIATIGAAILQPAVMGIAGVFAALAAIVWGLLALFVPVAGFDPIPQPAATGDDDEDELPYVPVCDGYVMPQWLRTGDEDAKPGDRVRPYWDSNIMGAPE